MCVLCGCWLVKVAHGTEKNVKREVVLMQIWCGCSLQPTVACGTLAVSSVFCYLLTFLCCFNFWLGALPPTAGGALGDCLVCPCSERL